MTILSLKLQSTWLINYSKDEEMWCALTLGMEQLIHCPNTNYKYRRAIPAYCPSANCKYRRAIPAYCPSANCKYRRVTSVK